MENTRSRGWAITLNNYTAEEVEAWKEVEAEYTCFGKEVGAEGTPHLQGYVVFKNKKSLKQVKALWPRAHLEHARANAEANRTYCSKDGDFFEKGTAPKTNREKAQNAGKARWKETLKRAREGDMQWLEENEPYLMITSEKKLKSLKVFPTSTLNYAEEDTPHEWIYGPPGVGKSRGVFERYPDAYPKDTNRWWDDYKGEVVVIEEVDPETMKHLASKMKKWVDRYPFMGETKGGNIKLRPPKIIIISNYTIDECFESERDRAAMKRRVKVIPMGVTEEQPKAWHCSYNL